MEGKGVLPYLEYCNKYGLDPGDGASRENYGKYKANMGAQMDSLDAMYHRGDLPDPVFD
jgi:hypothetical protein